MSISDQVVSVRRRWGGLLTRALVISAGVLGVLLGAELALTASVAAYDLALVGSIALGTVAAAYRLLTRESFEARLAILVLSVCVLVGQVLVSSFGGPGEGSAQWHPIGVLVAADAVVVLALIGVGALLPQPVAERRRPYAL